ncbi:ATPase inhibitor subunit zeta [Methylocapsa sp. S129]|uniref:ATPase inhibitor subunit zeta n=1 Tax=Methylocapsa sp. S129 TaxID=1641869 RepID=UPI00131DF505|nr:ATPase inhibitor subunit zeta [Methylocapsa sp. S129]
MSEFDNREEAFEKRFAVDEELAFKALARRNKLLGLWLAQLLGLSGAEADSYAAALVAGQVGVADPDGLFKIIQTSLAQARVELSGNRIRRKMAETMDQAKAEIMAGR